MKVGQLVKWWHHEEMGIQVRAYKNDWAFVLNRARFTAPNMTMFEKMRTMISRYMPQEVQRESLGVFNQCIDAAACNARRDLQQEANDDSDPVQQARPNNSQQEQPPQQPEQPDEEEKEEEQQPQQRQQPEQQQQPQQQQQGQRRARVNEEDVEPEVVERKRRKIAEREAKKDEEKAKDKEVRDALKATTTRREQYHVMEEYNNQATDGRQTVKNIQIVWRKVRGCIENCHDGNLDDFLDLPKKIACQNYSCMEEEKQKQKKKKS